LAETLCVGGRRSLSEVKCLLCSSRRTSTATTGIVDGLHHHRRIHSHHIQCAIMDDFRPCPRHSNPVGRQAASDPWTCGYFVSRSKIRVRSSAKLKHHGNGWDAGGPNCAGSTSEFDEISIASASHSDNSAKWTSGRRKRSVYGRSQAHATSSRLWKGHSFPK
jgi:hypothetical protein